MTGVLPILSIDTSSAILVNQWNSGVPKVYTLIQILILAISLTALTALWVDHILKKWSSLIINFITLLDWSTWRTTRSTTTSWNRLWLRWINLFCASSKQLRTLLHLPSWTIDYFRLCTWILFRSREQLVWLCRQCSMWSQYDNRNSTIYYPTTMSKSGIQL